MLATISISVALMLPARVARRAASPILSASSAWGGELSAEAAFAASIVQRAMQLCTALACDMQTVDASRDGKTMDECDTTAGVSFIKEGDSTPVTAADFAIQGLISAALREAYPDDRFLGEEDATDLRSDPALLSLALDLCARHGGDADEAAFLAAVDRGVEKARGEDERVWVLDPIDGTKGFMTGKGYVVGLALLVSGEPVLGAMGVPSWEGDPPLMVAVKEHGLRWWPAAGDGPLDYEPPRPAWADARYELPAPRGGAYPPWYVSPSSARAVCQPFGPDAPPADLCCGSMVKYFAVAADRAAGFIQYEEKCKTWDHACGVICVEESGGRAQATDAYGAPVRFPGREFDVDGGIVCCSRSASLKMLNLLRAGVADDYQTEALLRQGDRPF